MNPSPGERASSFIGPPMLGIRRRLPRAERAVSPEDLREILASSPSLAGIRKGDRVLVGVGSRGIAGLPDLVRVAVEEIRRRGARPEIVPAMGSHGGGTSEGQRELLASLGISDRHVGAPIIDPGSTEEIGAIEVGGLRRRLFVPRAVVESDHVILVNRVKPHTSFDGEIGSGLCKMLAVGLGGPLSAREAHGDGPAALAAGVVGMARGLMTHPWLPPLTGVAVVEDAVGAWAAAEVLGSRDWFDREPRLLGKAAELMGRLPVSRLDLLVVERMGKEISGTGMDTHVLGRRRLEGVGDPPGPRIERVVCCSLTEASHGNATGIGLADAVSRRLVDAMDRERTLRNVRASGFRGRAEIPPVFPTDRAAVESFLAGNGPGVSVAVLRDTLHLSPVYLSEAAAAEALEEPGAEEFVRLPGIPFTPDGMLRLDWDA